MDAAKRLNIAVEILKNINVGLDSQNIVCDSLDYFTNEFINLIYKTDGEEEKVANCMSYLTKEVPPEFGFSEYIKSIPIGSGGPKTELYDKLLTFGNNYYVLKVQNILKSPMGIDYINSEINRLSTTEEEKRNIYLDSQKAYKIILNEVDSELSFEDKVFLINDLGNDMKLALKASEFARRNKLEYEELLNEIEEENDKVKDYTEYKTIEEIQ